MSGFNVAITSELDVSYGPFICINAVSRYIKCVPGYLQNCKSKVREFPLIIGTNCCLFSINGSLVLGNVASAVDGQAAGLVPEILSL